jgi:drug/metabolite transporter (DMT)-like permease
VLSGERFGQLALAGMLLTVPAIVTVSVSAARRDAAQADASANRHTAGVASFAGLLAVTAVIYSLYPAGTIVLASVLSHERLNRTGISGLCLAAASVSLIAVGTVR